MNRTIVILGPTASGKSALAITLARKFKGEIISADSRQVYQGMDIGTGKVSKKEQQLVPHHLLSVVSPKKQFTASDFKRLALKSMAQIEKKKKLPFIVGGTAFYIYSLIDGLNLPEVKPNLKLRKTLAKKTAAELFSMLKNLDPRRAKSIDKANPARLIRAIEINVVSGKPVPELSSATADKGLLILGVKINPEKLRRQINQRVDDRIKLGMINEVKKLRDGGISFQRLESFGLEYRLIAFCLQQKLTRDQMISRLKTEINQFAKRQMTWFKKDKRIIWIVGAKQAEKEIKKFLA